MTAPIRIVIGLVRDLIGWISKIKFPSVPKSLTQFGRGAPPLFAAGYAGPSRTAYSTLPGRGGPGDSLFSSRISGAGTGTQIINITVTGALDPNAVAQQIEQLIVSRGRRLGRVT